MIHEFHLSAPGKGGVFCDKGGAFVGAVPMLARRRRNGKDEWRPRDCDELSREMSALYGLPVDMSSKRGSLTVIAKALNDGDVARAQVATLLLGVPDPPSLSKGAPSRQETIKLACDLRRSGFLKADWDPDEHPRWRLARPTAKADNSPQQVTTLRPVNPPALPRAISLLHQATTGATTAGGMFLAPRTSASMQVWPLHRRRATV